MGASSSATTAAPHSAAAKAARWRGQQARQMLAGGLAGAVAKTCTAPLGRLTILYQVKAFQGSQPGIWEGLQHIIRTQVCACDRIPNWHSQYAATLCTCARWLRWNCIGPLGTMIPCQRSISPVTKRQRLSALPSYGNHLQCMHNTACPACLTTSACKTAMQTHVLTLNRDVASNLRACPACTHSPWT